MSDTNLPPGSRIDPYAYGIASGVGDLYTPFLGPAPRPQKTTPYAKKSTAKWNMPESYIGDSEYLRDTMEDWMFTANQKWYTERILPWFLTDQIHLQWTEWENNAHYMGITPHQATSKVVTQKRNIRKASMVRRGIAAEFENGFVSTPLGRTSFMASLAQMARSVQETANVEVIRALLHCHRYQQLYIRKHGIVKDGDLDTWWERKASRFMTSQKDKNGLEILNTQIEREQEAYQAFSNVWILPREIQDYVSLIPPEKTDYNIAGPNGPKRVDGAQIGHAAAGGTMGNIRSLAPPRMIAGIPVYIAKSFVVDSVGKNDLLSRVTEVGVYNTMVDRSRGDYSEYRSSSRNIRVYDNDIDDWSTIEYWDALNRCVIWEDDSNGEGPISKMPKTRVGRIDRTTNSKNMEYDFLSYNDPGTDDTGTGSIGRANIEYVGDMSSAFLNEHNLCAAGQTVLNVISKHNGAAAAGREKLIADLYQALRRNADGGVDEYDTLDGDVAIAVNTIYADVQSILGKDNLLLTTAAAFYQTFFLAGFALGRVIGSPSQSRIPAPANKGQAAMRRAEEARKAAAAVNSFIGDVLGDAVPDSHKTQLTEIMNQEDQPFEDRAAAVKSLILQCHSDGLRTGNLKSPSTIGRWYNKSMKDFAEVMAAKHQEETPIATEPIGTQAGTPEKRYFEIGSTLPAGWAWADDRNSTASRNYSQAPTSLSQFVSLGERLAAGRSTSRRAQRRTGVGTAGHRRGGVSRVGAHAGIPSDRELQTGRDRRTAKFDIEVPPRYRNMTSFVNEIAGSACSLLVKWLAQLYLGVKFTRKRLVSLARKNVYVPLGLLLLRPHATYKTRFGIKCAANGDSGYTFFGHSNMQIEHEAARKVGMMHYTAYLSAVVFRPKNVYVVEDLFCEKYLGGMGVEFWKRTDYTKPNTNRRSRDIICAPLPPNFTRVEKKIDIRGKWYTEQQLGLVSKDRFQKPLYPGATRMNRYMGWFDPVRKAKGLSQHVYRYSRVPCNYVCFQGMQWHYNTKTNCFDDFIIEKGHFGRKVRFQHTHTHIRIFL
jgi:hypothetical protein